MTRTNGSDSKDGTCDVYADYGSVKYSETTLPHITQLSTGNETHGQNSKNSNGSRKEGTTTNSIPSGTKSQEKGTLPADFSGKTESQDKSSLVLYSPTLGESDGGDMGDSETMQLVDRKAERQLTNTEAILHLFKIFTGPSTIGMPAVIKNGGLIFGFAGFLICGYLSTYGNILVVNCGRILCRRTGKSALRYEELMEMAILSYSDTKPMRRVAAVVRRIIVVMLCLCQFGILAFYIQVIGTIVQYEFDHHGIQYTFPQAVTKIFICIALVPYSWTKNLKVLSWFSLLANISILVCAVTILQYACQNLQPVSEIPWITKDAWTIPLFISAAVFTVEGVPMLLPIENRVMEPNAYGGLCGIISLAATGNIILNLTLGFYGYLAFGDDVPGNILTALPVHWWYDVTSILYGLMVFLTFTLQLFLPAEFMVADLRVRISNEFFQKYADAIVRTFFVIAAYLMTLVVSNIELIMSVTGAVCSVPLLFLFPAAGELILLQTELDRVPWYIYLRNGLMFSFGVLAAVTGTITSVVEIIAKLNEED